jgi:hypothetical protein
MTRQNTRADYVRKAELALDEARNLDPNLAPHPDFEIAAIIGAARTYAQLAALPMCQGKIYVRNPDAMSSGPERPPSHIPLSCRLFECHDGDHQS